MNKTERAVIMAAGKGERLRPITAKVPKPLVQVNGKRMIDGIIDTLRQKGIDEIYVVIGYMKEQFSYLTDRVTLIENPYYDSYNNISSLYIARDYLKNAMILDGDQIIRNPNILPVSFEASGYCATWTEGKTDEWLMQTENGAVISCSRTGGEKGWQLYSVSVWSAEDGKKLKEFAEMEFEKGNRDIYWDDIPIFLYADRFKLAVHEIADGDIIEIDSINELAEVDPSYHKYRGYVK